MSQRKAKRRVMRLANRREVFRTYEIGTGEYAGTYAVWNETRPASMKEESDHAR